MKKTTVSILIAFALLGGFAYPDFAAAQPNVPVSPGQGPSTPQTPGGGATTPTSPGTGPSGTGIATLPNPLKATSIAGLFYDVVDFIISLSYVVIAFFLLLSGFKFVTAQGSEDKLGDAKRMFFNTVIGALIIIGANTIVAVVRTIIENLQK